MNEDDDLALDTILSALEVLAAERAAARMTPAFEGPVVGFNDLPMDGARITPEGLARLRGPRS